MAYSKAFRKGLEDAIAKARWRMEIHFKSHFHPEENPATLGDLHKSFVVMHDCLENLVTEIVNYLEPQLGNGKVRGDGRADGRGGAARSKARGLRRPAGRKSSRRSATRR